MANPFYTYSGAFIPGTLARAEQVGAEYSSVQAGFAVLAIQGIDSGTADTYVVTTTGGPSGAYADGNIVEFKAKTANTGAAATLNVNGIGAVSFTDFQGVTMASGAIKANTWYRAIYNSTYSAWTLIAPSSTVITSNTISAAAPTNKVGLTAAGGVSTACVPIDATYALDQSITPTWTGAHIFSSTVTFNSTVNFATGISITGAAGAYTGIFAASTTVGQSYGLLVKGGSNSSDRALVVNNAGNTLALFNIYGEGSVLVGAPTGGAKGIGSINAQALYVQGAAVLTSGVSSANPSATIGLSAVNGSAATFMTSDSAPPLSQAIAPTWTAAHTFTPSSAVTAVTINAKADTSGVVINGGTNTTNNYLLTVATAQGASVSSGLLVKAGTSSADFACLINNAANTKNYLIIRGDGSGSLGPSATAGALWTTTGATTINATGANALVVNAGAGNAFIVQLSTAPIFAIGDKTSPVVRAWGPTAAALVDMTPDTGSFTGTYATGFASTPTGTFVWTRNGNQVTLFFPAMSATSTTTGWTITGLPAAIQPARQQVQALSQGTDNGNQGNSGVAASVTSSGTITMFRNGSASGFTAAGVKGVFGTGGSITYMLN